MGVSLTNDVGDNIHLEHPLPAEVEQLHTLGDNDAGELEPLLLFLSDLPGVRIYDLPTLLGTLVRWRHGLEPFLE